MNAALFAEPCNQEVQVVRLDDSYAVLATVNIINRKEQFHRIEKFVIEVHFDYWCSCSAEYRESSYSYPTSA